MRFDTYEELSRFEKIKKRNRQKKTYEEEKFGEYVANQNPGSIHPVKDRKVKFGNRLRDDYKNGTRPGAVIVAPAKETNYETKWVPFSTQTDKRIAARSVYLYKEMDGVEKDCVALPEFSQWFDCRTLEPRKSILNSERLNEILEKEAEFGEN